MSGAAPIGPGTPYGRYLLFELLGRGGMAEVWKAKSFGVEGFEKTLAIKRILPALSKNTRFVDMFVHEAKLAVRLSHANVVQVFDLGRVDAREGPSYFMAMEYVAGLDLATLLARARRAAVDVPPELAVHVAAEVLKGLDHAHRRRDEQLRPLGVVHRDVSPQNVLLSWDGEVKVADFGIAKARQDVTDPSVVGEVRELKGKYSYMSPEQASGERIGPASDLFSLGTVLYETLGGKNPFSAPTPTETLRRVQAAEFPPLDFARASLAPDLVALVHRALSRRPEERFETAARFYEALLAHLYASRARFGAGNLAEFMHRFREGAPPPVEELGRALEHPTLTTQATPSSVRPSVPPPAFAVAAASTGLGALAGVDDLRDVSLLVVRFDGRAPVPPPARERARQILLRYGARVLKEAPRELCAAFGLNQADGRDSENAARCAMVLVRALMTPSVQPAAGIDAGQLRVEPGGKLVEDDRTELLVASARRLAERSGRRVAISDSASKLLRGMFALSPLPEAPPGTQAYVVGESRAREEALGRFVGRRAELRTLGELLAEASRRRLQVVGVLGEHGIGKTRLLWEMERRIAKGSFNIGCYLCACPPRGHEEPYSAVLAMLRTLCGVREGDPADRTAAVEPRLRALGLHDEDVHAVLGLLGAPRADAMAALGPGLRAAVTRMAASLAADRVHVFAWDDAQEMDGESVDLLHGVVRRLADARILLLFAGRPRDVALHAGIPGYVEIRLGPLEADDVVRLVGLRMGVRQVPEELIGFLGERAGGHPMFVEELLHEALESGAIGVADGRVEVLRLGGELAVPRPLRTLLAQRVRRLPAEERDLLVAASVLGEPVDTAVLAAMLGQPLGHVNAAAEALAARELLRREGPVALGFPSPLLPEVIASGLAEGARVELHARAANAYQMVLGERTEEEAGRIALHLAAAGERERAAAFYATAGLYHFQARVLDRAVHELCRAIELADLDARGLDELASWIEALARAVHHVRAGARLPEVVRRMGGHLARAESVDSRLSVRMSIDLASIVGALHRYNEAVELLAGAVERARRWPELLRSALAATGEVANRQGDFKLALRALDEASQLGPAETAEEMRLLIATAQAAAVGGQIERALVALDRADAIAPADDPVSACERAKVRALVFGLNRDWRGCAEACARGAELGRDARLLHDVAVNLHNQGESLMRLGELPRAYAAFQASLEVVEDLGTDRLVNLNRIWLAFLDAANGSERAGFDLGERVARAEAQGWTWDVHTGRSLLGRLLELRGDRAGARAEFRRARDLSAAAGNRFVAEDCERELDKMA